MDEEEIVTYEKMNFADLFSEVVSDLNKEVQVATETGASKMNTVLDGRIAAVKSQKFKSYFNYGNLVKSGNAMYHVPAMELILLTDEFDLVKAAYDRIGEDVAFLRACPEHARHGVLESIAVTADTIEAEWTKLRATMQKEDPNGCLMLQPFIEATSSMVMAPNLYATIGPEHDGVTAGHGLQLNLLLNTKNDSCVNEMAKIGHTKETYELEFVHQRDGKYRTDKYANGTTTLTQIRGCPPHAMPMPPFAYEVMRNDGPVTVMSTHQGIVPGDGKVVVAEVWKPTGLEEVAWLEANITQDKCPVGFVISHTDGSCGSHIYAHARGHNIPYIIGDVEVGETWVEGSPLNVAKEQGCEITPEPYDPYAEQYLQAFALGLAQSQTRWQRQHGWFAHYFHQWLGLNINPKHNALLSGAFAGWAVKAALGLCLGELRYAVGMKKDANVELLPVVKAMIGDLVWEDITGSQNPSKQRKHYYMAMERLDLDYTEMRMALLWLAKQFNTGWSGGAYGGKNWGKCAEGAAALAGAIISFQKNTNSDTILEVVKKTNEAENFAHNNGSLYNKFLSGSAFDYGTSNEEGSGYFSHSNDGICDMFRTYELARQFLTGTPNDKCARPVNDWMTIFQFTSKTNHGYYRKNFICNSRQIPSSIVNAARALGPELLHHNNKYSLNKDFFVPCGHEDCEKCADMNILTLNMGHEMDFTSTLLEVNHPSAFFALPQQKSSLIAYSVANLIKQKKYDDVTPELFVSGWNGLNTKDILYKTMSDLLKKHLKKKIVTDVEYTKQIQELMQGVVE